MSKAPAAPPPPKPVGEVDTTFKAQTATTREVTEAAAISDEHPTVVIQKVEQENPAIAILFDNLAGAVNECAAMTQTNTDAATVAACFRKLADALNKAAVQVENQ